MTIRLLPDLDGKSFKRIIANRIPRELRQDLAPKHEWNFLPTDPIGSELMSVRVLISLHLP